MGIGDDAAPFFLTKNRIQADDRDLTGRDDIVQDGAGPDRWQLVGVADEDAAALRLQSAEEMVHHFHVEHGYFIDDDQVGRQHLRFVVFKDLHGPDVAVGNEQAVDGLGLALRRFGQALGRPSRRCTKQDAQAFLFGQADDGLDDSRLARPRAAGDDGHAGLQGFLYGFALLVGQLEMARILPAVEEELDVSLHGQGLHIPHFADAPGNIFLFFIGFRRVDVQSPFKIGRTELAHFDAFPEDVVQPQGISLEDESRPPDQFRIWDTDVAILGHRPQDIGQAGAEALRVLPVHAVGQGNLVGRLEADAVDFSNHAVRFFRQDVVDVVAVFLQEPAGITAGDAVLFQVIGDVVDLFFFIEGFRNDSQLLRADAFDFQEPLRVFFQYGHGILAKGCDDAVGQGRSHALDGAAAQEAFDAVDRFGDDAAPAVSGELAAIALMLDPVALHFQAVADEGFRPVAGDGIRRIIVFIVQAEDAVIRIGRFK